MRDGLPNLPGRTRLPPLSRAEVAEFLTTNEAKIREIARAKIHKAHWPSLDSHEVLASVVRRLDRLANGAGVRPRSEAELWALVRCVTKNTAIEKSRLVARAQALVSSEGEYALQLLSRLEVCATDDEATLLVHRMALCLASAEERQILFLLLRGASFPAIAVALGSTEGAVRRHWCRLKHDLEERFAHGYLDD